MRKMSIGSEKDSSGDLRRGSGLHGHTEAGSEVGQGQGQQIRRCSLDCHDGRRSGGGAAIRSRIGDGQQGLNIDGSPARDTKLQKTLRRFAVEVLPKRFG
eukprot:5625928-Prymnesium_polylepis.1